MSAVFLAMMSALRVQIEGLLIIIGAGRSDVVTSLLDIPGKQ